MALVVQELSFSCAFTEELGGESSLFNFDINVQELNSLVQVMKSKFYRIMAGGNMVEKFVKGFLVIVPQHKHIFDVRVMYVGLFIERLGEGFFERAH